MVKKIHKSAAKTAGAAADAASSLFDQHLPAGMRESAQQIWLAGMGAFSRAQAEGGKVFEALIQEGMKIQRKTQGIAEEKISEVTGRMTSMAGDVQAKAGQHWDKLEGIFEQRTAKAMAKLGVPTARDVDALIKRVDELAAAVARLSGQPAAGKRATGRKAADATAATPKAAGKAATKRTAKSAAPKAGTATKRARKA